MQSYLSAFHCILSWMNLIRLPFHQTRLTTKAWIFSMLFLFDMSMLPPLSSETNPTNQANKKHLQEIIITGSKLRESKQNMSLQVDVIRREDIERMGAYTLLDVFDNLLSYQSYSHNVNRYVQNSGMDNSYTKVLMNGAPLITAAGTSEGFPLDHVDISSIEHIEIIRGANSSLYGSDAILGVINIITESRNPSPTPLKILLDNRIGFEGEYNGSLSFSGITSNQIHWHAKTSLLSDNGYAPLTNIGPYQKKDYQLPKRQRIHAEMNTAIPFHEGRISAQAHLSLMESLSTLTPTSRTENQDRNMNFMLQAERNLPYQMQLEGYSTYKQFNTITQNYGILFRSETNAQTQTFNTLETEIRTLRRFSNQHQILIGINLLHEHTFDTNLLQERLLRHTLSAFLQEKFTPFGNPSFILLLGTRFSYFLSDDSSNTYALSPNVAFTYKPLTSITLRANYGYGYKVATFLQQYYEFVHPGSLNFLLKGNPLLMPERGHSIQSSLTFEPTSHWEIHFESSYHRIHNLIGIAEEVPKQGIGKNGKKYNGIRQYENQALADRINLSAKIKADITSWVWTSLGYAYLHGRNTDENNDFRPSELIIPHQVKTSLGVRLPYLKTEINGFLTWYDRELISLEQKTYSDPYFNIDLIVRQVINQHMLATMTLKNALNTITETYDRQEGITFSIGLQLRLNNAIKDWNKLFNNP